MNLDVMEELKGLAVKTVIEGSVSGADSCQGEISLHIGRSKFLTRKYNPVL